jgi:hypothetical protein
MLRIDLSSADNDGDGKVLTAQFSELIRPLHNGCVEGLNASLEATIIVGRFSVPDNSAPLTLTIDVEDSQLQDATDWMIAMTILEAISGYRSYFGLEATYVSSRSSGTVRKQLASNGQQVPTRVGVIDILTQGLTYAAVN